LGGQLYQKNTALLRCLLGLKKQTKLKQTDVSHTVRRRLLAKRSKLFKKNAFFRKITGLGQRACPSLSDFFSFCSSFVPFLLLAEAGFLSLIMNA
jgi:hypothetical protein